MCSLTERATHHKVDVDFSPINDEMKLNEHGKKVLSLVSVANEIIQLISLCLRDLASDSHMLSHSIYTCVSFHSVILSVLLPNVYFKLYIPVLQLWL